jgi:tyrosinase
VKTGFSHFGRVSGQLESRPHNIVHVDIGGENQQGPGLMTDPETAGLDPIFWLHHANIDRLWEVWNASSPSHTNPTNDSAWMNGPLDRRFVVPTATGGDFFYTPAQMLNPSAPPLDYVYDQFNQPAAAVMAAAPAAREAAMTEGRPAELIGANSARLSVTGTQVRTNVQLDRGLAGAVAASFRGAVANAALVSSVSAVPSRDHVLLNLENIRAARNGAVIDVYLNLPEGTKPADRPDLLAGTIGLFGVRQASSPDQPHGGMGVSEVLDITNIVAGLEREGKLDPANLSVSLVPRKAADEAAGISVERVSVYRQQA